MIANYDFHMNESSWHGKNYIMQNGNKVLVRALEHYKNKLAKIGSDPQVKDMGGAFAMLLGQEAKNTLTKVTPIIEKIKTKNPAQIESLKSDVEILQKALNCYQADILKIVDTMESRYAQLFDEPKNLKEDLPLVKEALERLQ